MNLIFYGRLKLTEINLFRGQNINGQLRSLFLCSITMEEDGFFFSFSFWDTEDYVASVVSDPVVTWKLRGREGEEGFFIYWLVLFVVLG